MDKTIAIQGVKASFHDIAATQFFGKDVCTVSYDTFRDTFGAVKTGYANYAVCAIENSLYGSINEVYDLLVKNHFYITGEIYLRIEQCLIGLPGSQISEIKEVHSHFIALAQCEAYLDKVLPMAKKLEHHDTAASVEKIKNIGNSSFAAIASREAAELFGMEILAEEIETDKQNYTRFIVLEPKALDISNANKTSIIIKTSHKPGALYEALGAFAKQDINLSKLQSRPIIGKAWHYIFYVDVNAGSKDPALIEALKDLANQNCETKILGSYIAGTKT